MPRVRAVIRQRSTALMAIRAFGLLLITLGIGGGVLAGLRPDLVPAGHGVPAEAIGGAGLALGLGVALIGALHLVVSFGARDSRAMAAAGSVGAGALGVALLMGALAALVSAAMPLVPALLLGVAVYAWIAVLLAMPEDRSGPNHPS